MMQHQELIGRQRQFGVRLPFVVREFNLAGTIKELHDSADMAAHEAVRGQIREEDDDIQQPGCAVHY